MLAYRLLKAQTQPEFQEVPEPHAGPGQVVIKVAGSGLCHTDFIVVARGLATGRMSRRPSLSGTRSPDGWKSWEPE
jgi:propanol-preferring alcohol dehydrogenase